MVFLLPLQVRKTIPLTEVRQQLSDLLASDICMLPSSSACMSKMADTLRAAEVEKLSQELSQAGFHDNICISIKGVYLVENEQTRICNFIQLVGRVVYYTSQ